MKTLLKAFTIFLLSHNLVNAQLLIGPRAGLNMFTTSQEVLFGIDKKMQFTPAGGVAAGYEIGPSFNAFLEVNYMPGGQRYIYSKELLEKMSFETNQDTTITHNTNYVQVPIYFQVYYQKPLKKYRLFLNMGPYLGFGKSDSIELYYQEAGKSNGRLRNVWRRGFDFGAVIGPGVQYKIGQGAIQFEARYQLGLNELFKLNNDQRKEFGSSQYTPLPKAQNRQFYVALGYTHFIKVNKKEAIWFGEPPKKNDADKEEPKRRKRS
jgi:hypothetical protein